MSQLTVSRLDAWIKSAAPIDGVQILDHAAKQVRIDYPESATGVDKANGDAALATFNWDDAEDDNFVAEVNTKNASDSIDQGVTIKGGSIDRLTVAITLVAMDGINDGRKCQLDLFAAIAAATSLADLKTKVAAIPAPPQVTPSQVLNAVKAKLLTLPK